MSNAVKLGMLALLFPLFIYSQNKIVAKLEIPVIALSVDQAVDVKKPVTFLYPILHIPIIPHVDIGIGYNSTKFISQNPDINPQYDYELAKMAVSPAMQGKNIGFLLGRAVIEKAIALGARNVYLESNTILTPAIHLYHKLGFTKVVGHTTPYERCNIQMSLSL